VSAEFYQQVAPRLPRSGVVAEGCLMVEARPPVYRLLFGTLGTFSSRTFGIRPPREALVAAMSPEPRPQARGA